MISTTRRFHECKGGFLTCMGTIGDRGMVKGKKLRKVGGKKAYGTAEGGGDGQRNGILGWTFQTCLIKDQRSN